MEVFCYIDGGNNFLQRDNGHVQDVTLTHDVLG